jgi:L-alanine-DL-glutamate epimerase-like enolase superfamily enzyme
MFDSRARILSIVKAAEQIREGLGPDGNWAIDIHQKFDFQEAVEICRLIEPFRPYFVEDLLREEQFRTQIPAAAADERAARTGRGVGPALEFNTLVEDRDIDFARATLPNVGGVTEMLKIMAMCDTHKVGIVPHFTGPVGTAAHIHAMTAFPGQVVMEYNYDRDASAPDGVRRVPRWKVLAERPAGIRCHTGRGAAHTSGGAYGSRDWKHLSPPRRIAVALVIVRR